MTLPRPLVSIEWVARHLDQPDLVLLDCRFDTIGDPEEGRRAYSAGHIPGAVYLHLNEDLSGPVGPHGGRHPLPDPAVIAAKLGRAGVGPGVRVVAYDWTGEHAARCWWLLRWLGHDEVAVMNGGFRAWESAGHPVTADLPSPAARTFTPRPRREMIAEMAEVRGPAPGVTLVDGRAAPRFSGQPHPLDAKPGHIPGAQNRFWGESLRPDGFWLEADAQRARFTALPAASQQQVHYCGSGVTACANLLALEIAGLTGARLYPGSWSDWCSYDENPIEK